MNEAKKVLITGANRGLGFEFAKQYLSKGCFVVACCRDRKRAAGLEELSNRYPEILYILEMNVSDEASIAEAAKELAGRTESLDILINNAGTYAEEEGLDTVSMAQMIRVFSVNSFGPVMVTKYFRPFLKKGTNPLTASLYSGTSIITREKFEKAGQYSYGPSKAALNMLIKCMAADLEEDSVCVIGIGPGFVLTDMTKDSEVKPTLLPEESVAKMISILAERSMEDTGKIFEYTGEEVDLIVKGI